MVRGETEEEISAGEGGGVTVSVVYAQNPAVRTAGFVQKEDGEVFLTNIGGNDEVMNY